MKTSAILLALVSLLSHLLILTAQPFVYYKCFNESGNYTKSSAYHNNLNTILSNFTYTKVDYGFYNYSLGKTPDTVNALGMCRGDVKEDSCLICLNNAISLLPKLCPYQKEAFGYHDLCMLRYSSRPMSGIYQDPDFKDYEGNQTDAEHANEYMGALYNLTKSLISKAMIGDSHLKVAAGNAKSDQSDQAVYGLVQCTPDLNDQSCFNCLKDSIFYIPNCCQNKVGGRVIRLSCYVRFENFLFFDSTRLDTIQLHYISPAPSTNTPFSPGISLKTYM